MEQATEGKEMKTIKLTKVQYDILKNLDVLQGTWIQKAIENNIENKVFKTLSVETRRGLILLTPAPKWWSIDRGHHQPTDKERLEKAIKKEEQDQNIIQLIPSESEKFITDWLLFEQAEVSNSKSFPGHYDYSLVFDPADTDKLINEIVTVNAFCTLVAETLLPYAENYHFRFKEMKKLANQFKRDFGVKPKVKVKSKPRWLQMFEACMEFQRDIQYISGMFN